MKREEKYTQAKELLVKFASEWTQPEEDRLDGVVEADKLPDAVRLLVDCQWGYLGAITGLDLGETADKLETLYHFCSGNAVLTLRVAINRSNPVVPSICDMIAYASPYERETAEMFGITFAGAPDTSRLFLPDDWESGVYPLRKDVLVGEPYHEDDHAS